MDPSDNFPANRSPRSREILGPRPTPLKVRKDPHKTRRPPLAPPQPPLQQHQDRQEAPPHGGPVIIYTVSPKIIHANPRDFMTIVQRLTGKTPSSSSSSSSTSATSKFAPRETMPFGALNDDNNTTGGLISPAARYAAMEKANASSGFVGGIEMGHEHHHRHHHHHHQHQHQNLMSERPSFSPGILSPGPTSLPPISPTFFSPPPPDPSGLPFYGDLSSILQTSPSMTSPYSSLELFNNFPDM